MCAYARVLVRFIHAGVPRRAGGAASLNFRVGGSSNRARGAFESLTRSRLLSHAYTPFIVPSLGPSIPASTPPLCDTCLSLALKCPQALECLLDASQGDLRLAVTLLQTAATVTPAATTVSKQTILEIGGVCAHACPCVCMCVCAYLCISACVSSCQAPLPPSP
eukprot:GHVU01211636.1.p1 GENE.GHVU01211636.1~~GHVU01211636.1.p1  ORF type:complete len:164 (-),score=1.60 GHVU01211636.1:470-961(-)